MAAKEPGGDMSVGEHINELRSRLIKSAIVLFVFAVVAFILKDDLINIIFGPTNADFITNRLFCQLGARFGIDELCINQNVVTLVNTKMAGQFNMHIKMAFIAAIVFTVPFLLYQLWMFIKPALSNEVQKQCRLLVFQVSVWFFIGMAFGYYIVAPLAVNFLTNYQLSDQITNLIEVTSYLSSVMGVSLACAAVFQLPLLIKLLASIGILTSSMMRKYRKVSFAAIIILAAIITPPDVFSQVLVACPLYVLFEYGIIVAQKIENKKAAKKALEEMKQNS
ncbi:MAG: twin-arginine translocase subunit TatC [Rikenellaceae bacterium]